MLPVAGPRVRWCVVSSAGVVLLCLLGDYLLAQWDHLCELAVCSPVTKTLSKALMDNLVHAAVAGWSWFNTWLLNTAEKWSRVVVMQALCCTALGSLLDVDHFIQAASLNVQDAVRLTQRPFLHNTTLTLLLSLLLFVTVHILTSHRPCPPLLPLPALFLVASLSHQLRDSTRRGVWLPPLGTLPPHSLYLVLIVLLPVVIVTLKQLCTHSNNNHLTNIV